MYILSSRNIFPTCRLRKLTDYFGPQHNQLLCRELYLKYSAFKSLIALTRPSDIKHICIQIEYLTYAGLKTLKYYPVFAFYISF